MANADPLAHFTDRQQQIEAFDRLWASETPWVLAFDGLAGNGKSTLIRWLIRNRCERESIPYAVVDLVNEATRTDFAVLLGHWEDGLAAVVLPKTWRAYRDGRRGILAELNRQRVEITAIQKMDATGSAAVTNTQQTMDVSNCCARPSAMRAIA